MRLSGRGGDIERTQWVTSYVAHLHNHSKQEPLANSSTHILASCMPTRKLG